MVSVRPLAPDLHPRLAEHPAARISNDGEQLSQIAVDEPVLAHGGQSGHGLVAGGLQAFHLQADLVADEVFTVGGVDKERRHACQVGAALTGGH
jgi:hypothetical protein